MLDPFQVLEREHRLISQVLEAVALAVEREMPLDYYKRAIEFFEVYAGDFHHAKEEDILYRSLIEHGMPRDYGPLGVILEEHDYGHAHLEAMKRHLDAGDQDALLDEMRQYLEMLRGHVKAEDEVLLPMGRAMLTAEEISEMAEAFEAVPEPPPSLESWTQLAEKLMQDAGAPA